MKKEVRCLLFCMNSNLVIILFHDNALSHAARRILKKLTDLGYESLPHPSYFLNLAPTCREEENLVFCFGAQFNSTLNFTQSG